jgi:citrate lyase subunit alpha/citrate CoA-transferase
LHIPLPENRKKFGERVVGIIESRDGTIMDVVREMKEFEFEE